MNNYKLIILGYPVNNPKEITYCFQMLTYGLYKYFSKLSHVKVIQKSVKEDLTILPNADFIIVSDIREFFNKKNLALLRTKCKKVISFLENRIQSDYSFCFKDAGSKFQPKEKSKIIHAPYLPDLVKIPKSRHRNTILLDHIWLYWWKQNKNDWEISKDIYKWLYEIKDKYEIACLVKEHKDHAGDWSKEHLKVLPSFIKPIFSSNYVDYLKATEKYEYFILTHAGSYNYSIIDMIARGIKVLVPKINRHLYAPIDLVKRFNFQIFKNKHQLLNILKNRRREPCAECIRGYFCTPMNEVVEIIDKKLRSWL